jgi:hypothetical protein
MSCQERELHGFETALAHGGAITKEETLPMQLIAMRAMTILRGGRWWTGIFLTKEIDDDDETDALVGRVAKGEGVHEHLKDKQDTNS